MDVIARPAPGSEVDRLSFTDLTNVRVVAVEWIPDGFLQVTFAAPITDAEAAAVRRRLISATPAEEELRAACEAYLEHPTTPTLDQVHLQLLRLTQLMTKVV
ncbi:hypothetical protein [Nocardioides lijunqiniae]|uniref:hypothetical protein n=1 Tax=Nocardioides lijunqiniae TaxID=2760832 RepID=UPI001878F115|nr:hypothetical protein [Nocardioides lijunqiniae]